MPQYQELPCGGQVLDIDAALKDGILGCGPEPGDGALGDGGKQPVELRKMMDELDAAGDGGGDEVVPAVFICPISLEPMVDPVTLCTGQTYERANISRWLALGHRTCPTTMQELWDDALTPNATLRQLIAAWFSRRYTRFKKRSADYHGRAADLVHGLRGTAVPRRQPLKGQARVAALRELRSLACAHQSVTKAIAEACGVSLLTSLLGPFTSHSVGSEAVAILVSGVPLDADAKAALMQPAKVSLVVDMLNEGAVDTKINCVRLIRILMEEKGFRPETVASLSLLAGSMRLVRDKRHQDGVAAGLELLNSICAVHRPARSMIVSIGAVQQLVELLPELATECVEPALDILDALASVPEGRTALKDCPRTIPNAVRLLMRVSEACTQRALSMLWVVCRMVPEESAPAALDVGLAAKLLLVIQSGCGPELKQQASELLKLCTVHCTSTVFLAKCKLTKTIQ
ncbi:hypothetical protein CFC21_051401 [Triticum aestivum]|uniref:U-box domain-containing protein n=4 Tax=Triticum TaxID=4564 RepID=A0A9R0S507_TRITD|nr:U-box domain-containing protein 75 [Triticum dicoccoides]XP_048571923.1 U-box domain-containing protein 75 [Triticum urartu]KAF7041634.1 hypothetical protein CFC21_051401 [Triticum aestivum]VAH88437.1 unnamed protein product [Triticum turgidum subsp. durum]